jgi:hypothetical protein
MKSLLLTLSVFVLLTGNAHAYLDPGTGSILLQGLLAGLLALGAFWRQAKAWVLGLFGRKNDDQGA